MLNENTGAAPLIATQNMVPWWMIRIMDFDRLEIKPCEIIGYTLLGSKITQPCEPEEASYWTVYGHYRSSEVYNGIEPFEDFNTKAEAQRFHDRILAAYPHFRGERPDPTPSKSPQTLTP